MKKSLKLTASMTLVTLLAASSAFAETRHRSETDSYRSGSRSVSVEGRIRDIDRDRNGFVIHLDRGSYALFVSPRLGRSVRNLDRGDVIRAYGQIDSRGTMLVDDLTLLRNADRNDHSVRGVVQSVDVSRRVVSVREDRSGRIILVDLRNAERNDRRWDNDQRDDRSDNRQDRWNDLNRIRRGDRLSARGEYRGNGRFEAERYDLGENGSR